MKSAVGSSKDSMAMVSGEVGRGLPSDGVPTGFIAKVLTRIGD